MLTFLKGQDLFGFPIEINFDKNGSSFNTGLGGIFSILIKATLIFYTFQKTSIMLKFDDDKKEKYFQNNLNFTSEEVSMADTGVFPHVAILQNKRMFLNRGIPLAKEIGAYKQYVKANFYKVTVDYNTFSHTKELI